MIVKCPTPTLARLFDPLAWQLARRSAPQISDPQSAEITDKSSDPPNERPKALEPNVGTLLYLVSLGFVAIATVVVFFGLGFLLLAHSNEELIAGPDARNRVVKIEPRPSDLAQPPDKNGALSTTQTASASPVLPTQMPEPHYDILPLARSETAVGSAPAAETGAANGMSHASSDQNQPGLRSNTAEAAAATAAGITNTKETGSGRHRHVGARRHWSGTSRPGSYRPQATAISGPERAWHWIFQSATNILAALSPPPSRQARGLKTPWRAD